MAVDFPTDLILDVARAADPQRVRSVTARLEGAASAGDAATVISDAAKLGSGLSRVRQDNDAHEVAKEFEALLVSNMINTMMGESEDSFFGGGFAGGVWKSMMAEQVAKQVVKTADFGVADKVTKYMVREGDEIAAVSGVNDADATPFETRSLDAARSGTNEISRDFIRKMMDLVDSGGRG